MTAEIAPQNGTRPKGRGIRWPQTTNGSDDDTEWVWVTRRLAEAVSIGASLWSVDIDAAASPVLQVVRHSVAQTPTWHTGIGCADVEACSAGDMMQDRPVLSVTVQLSPLAGFSGGQLEIAGHGNVSQAQGTLVVFPAVLPRKEHAMTSGARVSLVASFAGKLVMRPPDKVCSPSSPTQPTHAALRAAAAAASQTLATQVGIALVMADLHERILTYPLRCYISSSRHVHRGMSTTTRILI